MKMDNQFISFLKSKSFLKKFSFYINYYLFLDLPPFIKFLINERTDDKLLKNDLFPTFFLYEHSLPTNFSFLIT